MAAEETPEGSSWQEIDSPPFKQAVSDLRFVNISIKCYEKKTGSGFKEEYYAYKILAILSKTDGDETEPSSSSRTRYETWRRYSEFEMLRNFMQFVYPHVVMPPLPEKAIRGSANLLNKITFSGEDVEFLLQRQHALEIFLVRISRHPVLSKNVWFHEFLKTVSWKEKLLQSGYNGKGSETLFQSLSLQLSKHGPDSRFQDAKAYATDLDTILRTILEIRQKLNSSMTSLYKVHSNYGRIFNEMSLVEDKLGTPLQVASGCLDNYADSSDSYFNEEESRFYLPIKEYIGFSESLKSLTRRHEVLQKQLEKAEELVSSRAESRNTLLKNNPEEGGTGGKKFSFKSLSARLRGEDISYEGQKATAERELTDAEEALTDIQKEFDEFTRDALQELENFNDQKFGDFRSMLINYVQLQLHIHKKGMTTWQRIKDGFETEN
ncbi:PREDICTED: sorting nexin-4-like [Amphimedon queenslandica]|uniref:PX domain-containing protein n=1 Tax=Amphimedon queenslandica TaxID=400682 RepID=A0A1X7VB97_AMPQE|nr:PREDICTED: sorting nexin-4-like [Amphimedon queenslandica]|eukprot:XP_019849679.1 PREDICTED: sorting nexin-4-like [Amphimedon queenslandica]